MQVSTPSSPTLSRLWRPAAQRSLRNSWSSISMELSTWSASSSFGFSAASALVNSLLSSRYIEHMDFGVLTDMHDIQTKSRNKLFHHGEARFMEMLTSYKRLVHSLSIMQKSLGTMRTYLKGSSMPHLVEFSEQQYLENDDGDGDGQAVFSTLPVKIHEMLAQEILDMFVAEIKIKWIIIVELRFILYKELDDRGPNTMDKLMGEIYVEAASKLPGILDAKVSHEKALSNRQGTASIVKRELLQVYLTAWLTEVNIRKDRKEEILSVISEEMHIAFKG